MASLISPARTSSAPRNTPGKARTLLIWLGKSLRPVPTTAAPAALASSGIISGTGLAMGKRMGSPAIERTISAVSSPGAETPTKRSAPTSASFSPPRTVGRVRSASSARARFSARSLRPGYTTPAISQRTALRRPMLHRSLKMAVPAAPAPEKTAEISSILFPVSFSAFIRAAATTMAVPC